MADSEETRGARAAERNWSTRDGRSGTRLYMWCPGCDDLHAVEVANDNRWTWDRNLEAPTISPSILCTGVRRCHSYVKAGCWEFLGDSEHALAGQTVPLPPLPQWLIEEVSDG